MVSLPLGKKGLAMSVAASAVSVYSAESVVESSEGVTLTRIDTVEPPLRSRVAKVLGRITTAVEQAKEPSGVDVRWFRRGVEQANYAYFEASLLPAKRRLQQAIEAYLDSPEAQAAGLRAQVAAQVARLNGIPASEGGSVGWALLVDECLFVAFENRAQWQSGSDPVDWVAGFVPQAAAQFVDG